jgi:GntR family transcriptional regulator, transcriptional repressor for pyruvate dehydrogenase complex
VLWGLRPVEAKAAHWLAVDSLRRQIHSGLLLPAERLPAERQLSDQFGISRVTLREALRVLETGQYISVRRGAQGGAFVTDERRLGQLARRRIARAPAATMRVVEFIEVNQNAAARLAAVRRSAADLKRLQEAAELMRRAATGPEHKQGEAMFLLALGNASQNALLARAIEDGLAELFLPFDRSPADSAASAALRVVEDLLRAVTDSEAAAAEAAARELHALLWKTVRQTSKNAA